MEREVKTRPERIALYEKNVIGFLRDAVAEDADKKLPPRMTQEQ